MSKFIEVENFPEYAVNYAYYGDSTNLTDIDIQNIDSFMTENHYSMIAIKDSTENGFCKYPVFGLPCRTVTVIMENRSDKNE
jgi:hypothetical protein